MNRILMVASEAAPFIKTGGWRMSWVPFPPLWQNAVKKWRWCYRDTVARRLRRTSAS